MPKKPTLTLEELNMLLHALFSAERRAQVRLQARLAEAFGNEIHREKPEYAAINNRLMDWVCDLIAHRLKRNRHATPLFTSRDFARILPSMIDDIAKIDGVELLDDDRAILEKFIMAILTHATDMVYAIVPPRTDPYDTYWRWITIALDLTRERGITPDELFTLDGITDEITRRMFTKRQFSSLTMKRLNKILSEDTLMKIILQPFTTLMECTDNEHERYLIQQAIEATIAERVPTIVAQSKAAVYTWLSAEVARIYAR